MFQNKCSSVYLIIEDACIFQASELNISETDYLNSPSVRQLSGRRHDRLAFYLAVVYLAKVETVNMYSTSQKL
jgi:hypothetical protein